MSERKLFRNPLDICMSCKYLGRDFECTNQDSERRGLRMRVYSQGATKWGQKCPHYEMDVWYAEELERAKDPEKNAFVFAFLVARAAARAVNVISDRLRDEPRLDRVLREIEALETRYKNFLLAMAEEGSLHAVFAPEDMRETVRSWAAEQAYPGRPHELHCDDQHCHVPPKCCSTWCWCRTYGR